ncbi:protein TolR [Acinetobacter sp. B5B]|uniref:protein TolR n=1 Tax=Acinetobacter baretiae TaxID=2605383 RepID=UPI0018C3218D|nr:protein TolR [Acinetobacter baretiae]MBF7682079.1 protein TolR [Acinetobacter baretiae]MBF7684681.1 protein TolR [Acinetobacter baretiae]
MAIQRSGRFSRIKKPLKSDMNVVPYIDVMLVLLVIFMVTAPMITSSIKVDLPKASSQPFEAKSPPAIVSLNDQGEYFLQYAQYKNQKMSLESLKTALANEQSQQQQLTVLINGAQSRPYGDVVALMASLQGAGLTQVGLLTDPVK